MVSSTDFADYADLAKADRVGNRILLLICVLISLPRLFFSFFLSVSPCLLWFPFSLSSLRPWRLCGSTKTVADFK